MNAGGMLRVVCAAIVLLSACASPPPPPPKPTVIVATLYAKENVNPDRNGRPSPVVVHFYELKTLAAFNAADFDSIIKREKEVLGADLVAREEQIMKPGGDWKIGPRTLHNDTRNLAVVAEFRDLDRAQWRAVTAVPLNQTTTLTITFDDKRVVIALRP